MSWLDALGWAGSALLVWSLLQARILRLRALNLIGSVILLVFNALIQVWPMVGLNTVLAGINIFYLVRLVRTRHDKKTYQVVEVGAGDDLPRHLLARHAGEIAAFFPGFRWRPDRLAFLVLRNDEIVGVVMVRDAGDGVAQVELDYVTQRFRDFTPGEFVYQRSRLFTERGFRRVVTPPGMVEPYYPRLGFQRDGDVYVLELGRDHEP
ncbi:MAG TPA: hypothetical protein VFC19_21935 [Candidatus Limnocylindrales bacterium]|nr:hypothetical protein [Candidatus Limnocylindrales bacterium]